MSIRDLFYALGFAGPTPAPPPMECEPWSLYFTLDDEHQVVVTVEHDSLVLGTYEQTIEVQVCGSSREDCMAAYFRYLENCE